MKDIKSNSIVVLPSFYPMKYHYTRGGFFEEQTKLIFKTGVNISVVFNEDRSITSFTLRKLRYVHFQKELLVEDGIMVYRMFSWNLIPAKFSIGRKIWIKNSINLVKSYLKFNIKPSLFHVHCAFNAGSIAIYYKQKFGIPYIITEHSSRFVGRSLTIEMKKNAFDIYDNADKVIVVSSSFKKTLSKTIGFDERRIEVIPNFIDTDFFKPDNGDINEAKIIFTVCHHVYIKRLDRLLDAFSRLLLDYPEWTLIIGGNGPETRKLKLKVDKLGISDNVKFLGFMSQKMVRDAMAKASFFALTSDYETFGVVIIEAMAMGLPVVATSCGGPEDIITLDTGLLVEKDEDCIAKGLEKMILNFRGFDKQGIRNYALENYSGHVVAKKYAHIYSETIAIMTSHK